MSGRDSISAHNQQKMLYHPAARAIHLRWRREEAQPLPPHAKHTHAERVGPSDSRRECRWRLETARLYCVASPAGSDEAPVPPVPQRPPLRFARRPVPLPEVQTAVLSPCFSGSQSLTGIAQLLLAVPLQAEAGRWGAFRAAHMQPVGCCRQTRARTQ